MNKTQRKEFYLHMVKFTDTNDLILAMQLMKRDGKNKKTTTQLERLSYLYRALYLNADTELASLIANEIADFSNKHTK